MHGSDIMRVLGLITITQHQHGSRTTITLQMMLGSNGMISRRMGSLVMISASDMKEMSAT